MSDPAAAAEYVTFLQHQLPGLEAGRYTLTVSQHVTDSAGQPISGETLSQSYAFAIYGDRFRLSNPAGTVASTFPASNASGTFGTVLPHVVFTAASFPWTRYPTRNPPQLPAPGTDTETDVPTWLAVLVLDDDDAAAFPGQLALDPVTRVLGDLFPPAAHLASTPGQDYYSYFTAASDTTRLEAGETVSDHVQTIDIPLKLFADIAPTLADLSLTAHVRQVAVENKPVPLGATPSAEPVGTFAIVIGNRLPQRNKRSHAYLVSLEGLEDFLPGTGDGGATANASLVMSRPLRLAVLQHWTFTSKDGAGGATKDGTGSTTKDGTGSFVGMLAALNHGGADANTNLRLTVSGASQPVSAALNAGYVPLDHDLRTGETTVSWYRGPLSPIDRARGGPALPVSSPDQVLAFDPTTGMFDASLAAAWTIGRLAALQDQSYAVSLYRWKKSQAQDVVDRAERKVIDDALAGLIAAPASQSTSALLHDTMRLIKGGGTP
jgi:hypothetical protein